MEIMDVPAGCTHTLTVTACSPHRREFRESGPLAAMDDLYLIVFLLICLVMASLGGGALLAHFGDKAKKAN